MLTCYYVHVLALLRRNTELELLLTPEEAARLLGLSLFTVRRLLRLGELPGRKVGKRQWRISRADLEEYLRVPRGSLLSIPASGAEQKQDRIALLAAQQRVRPVADFDI